MKEYNVYYAYYYIVIQYANVRNEIYGVNENIFNTNQKQLLLFDRIL